MLADYKVCIDACVLANYSVSDLLLRLAERPRIYTPVLSNMILDEVRRTHVEKLGWGEEMADSWQTQGVRHFKRYLEAVDFSGAVIGTDNIDINNTGTIVPASAANLAVTELMYNPAAPTAGEISAGFTSESLFEYIEVMNIGTDTIDLTGVNFVDGITFTFLLSV